VDQEKWQVSYTCLSCYPEEAAGQELWVPELRPENGLQLLEEKGGHTLICGALSTDLPYQATQLGLTVVSGVAGEVGKGLSGDGEFLPQ
jgi:hypothetical protein